MPVDGRRMRGGVVAGLGARVVEGRRLHAERIEHLRLHRLVVRGAELHVGVGHRDAAERARFEGRRIRRDLVVVRDDDAGRRGRPHRHDRPGKKVEAGERNRGASRGAAAARRRGKHEALGELGGVAFGGSGGGGDRRAGADGHRKHDVDGRVAAAVGRDLRRTEVLLTFAKPLRPRQTHLVHVKVDRKRRVRQAVQGSDDRGVAARRDRRRDDRKVLPVVGPRIGIAEVVQRDTVAGEIDADPRTPPNSASFE